MLVDIYISTVRDMSLGTGAKLPPHFVFGGAGMVQSV